MMTRRELIHRIFALAAWGALNPLNALSGSARADDDEAVPFNKAWLREQAKTLSESKFTPPKGQLPAWIESLDWDGYQSIRFNNEHSLWREGGLPYQARLFHLGLFFKHPVTLHEVVDGLARPIHFSPELFDYTGKTKPPKKSGDLGFAGFRIHHQDDFERDMFSFLGASYFRAVGSSKQYGLSARGLAIDTGMNRPEEFPEFKSFWLERPKSGAENLTIHALLDSPSVTGAYTFVVKTGEPTVMQVESHLFPRKTIERIGIAPLTSMYQTGENDRRVSDDFRPEIHDSDGLALWTGTDEWIWRPLVNPAHMRVNSFFDENPRGFGLLQRDRDFDHYLDDGAYYDKRPSLWIEPKGAWGKGSVQLVEIQSPDETFDNIVVFWNPSEPVIPGKELSFQYTMYWGANPHQQSPAAQVIATRIGVGGIPGQKKKIPSRKFVIDFQGGRLEQLAKDAKVEAVVTASRGTITAVAARPIKELYGWRCNFDLVTDNSREPVDLRCYLRDAQGALTETWLYQWTPPA
ncbi:glucan biosynthesis protein [Methylococcus sp. EFPC2]|uniref:glucan biosynthesis protein n=1 Tax=Methylococcus sp. EFPC2 TaxID=2812648 RepID=UPI001968019B|nr:glucan biosynthesis protein D [Methylococcus sp. EFPC2]QSA98633.1 glucan biosynthesis protein D [Methylococcus sp. EFPC2]